MDPADALLRAATYLKWWRDGAIAQAEPPEDLGALIILLERVAVRLQQPGPTRDVDTPDEQRLAEQHERDWTAG
jgi:hypothetical protein